MPVSSMTGFTGATGQHGAVEWSWEIRSVNGRGLDVRVRLPAGCESLERTVREAAGNPFLYHVVPAVVAVPVKL